MTNMKTFSLLMLALFAFAGNSLLNRMALKGELIDAESFTLIRLTSGSLVLMALVFLQSGTSHLKLKNLKSGYNGAFVLFVYAICFSVAYLSLDTGTGALILFAVVQMVLLLMNFLQGNRLTAIEWCGAVLAILGLFVLLLPGASAPDLSGFILMSLAGIAWGLYTWLGRGSENPLADTALNFMKSLLFCIPLFLWVLYKAGAELPSTEGIWLAVISGTITSGLGYAIWYRILPLLSVLQSALSQLLVPVIAALAGMIFLGEELTLVFVIASFMILGGLMIVQLTKRSG